MDVIGGVESALWEGCPRTMTGVSQRWFSGHFRQVFFTPLHYPAVTLAPTCGAREHHDRCLSTLVLVYFAHWMGCVISSMSSSCLQGQARFGAVVQVFILGSNLGFISLVLGPQNSLVWYVPSLRYTRGLDWCIHCGVEVTESSTNKQHHLSAASTLLMLTQRSDSDRHQRGSVRGDAN